MTGQLEWWAAAIISAVAVKCALLYVNCWNSLTDLYTEKAAQVLGIILEAVGFVAQFLPSNLSAFSGSIGSLNGLVWAVLTGIANIILDVTVFLNIIDARISYLGG